MSKATAQEYPVWFERLVEKWRLRLIPDWSVSLMPNAYNEEGEANTYGQSQCNFVYRRISIWVNLAKGDRAEVEQTLVHELLHALLEAIDDAYNPAMQHVGKFERALIERAAESQREHLIEVVSLHLVALEHGAKVRLVSEGRPGYVA